MNADKYSIISLKNPEDSESGAAYVNLPVSWQSQGGSLDVKFSEQAL